MFGRHERTALLMAQAKEHVKELAAPMQEQGTATIQDIAVAMFWAGRLSGLSSSTSRAAFAVEAIRAESDCERLTAGVPDIPLSDYNAGGEAANG